MRLDVSLQVSLRDDQHDLTEDQRPKVADRVKFVTSKTGGRTKKVIKSNVSDVITFLAENPTAKIMVIIETHSLENGRLIWSTKEGEYQGCFMEDVSIAPVILCPILSLTYVQILRDCIPHEIYNLISDGPETPLHNHKSFILNLSCGASVSDVKSRSTLLEG